MTAAVVPFEADRHAEGVAALCRAEGWGSYADPAVVARVFTAPGVTALAAVDGGRVVGAAQALGDGLVQAYLALLVVAPSARGQGTGRRLVAEVMRRSGTRRLDLLAEGPASAFYERFPHRRLPGYRLHPG